VFFHNEKRRVVFSNPACRGSFVLSRLANYYPSRFSKYVFLDVGYIAPNHALTVSILKHVNAAIQAALGYSILGYFLFFNDPDAAELMNKKVCLPHTVATSFMKPEFLNKVESAGSLFHAADEELRKEYLGQEGGFRTWLTEGKTAEWPD
jgi:soluble epoxide hydrolase / lipid-phosphate phosphatase